MTRRRRASSVSVILFLLSLAIPPGALPAAWAGDWPSIRGDARNSGYTPVELAPPLTLAWRSPARVAYTHLLSSGGAICVGTRRGETLLFNNRGQLLWKIDRAIPAYLKNELLVVVSTDPGASDPRIECFNWRTKTPRWTHSLGGNLQQFWGAVALEGRLYCAYNLWGSDEGQGRSPIFAGMTVLDVEEGTPLAEWIGAEGGWGEGPPASDGQSVYWGMSHFLHALDARTLEPQWTHYDGGNVYPLSAGNLIITQGWSHQVQAVSKNDRKKVWGLSAWRGAAHCLAKGAGGTLLLIESSASPQALVAVEVATGRRVWRYPIWVRGRAGEGLAAAAGRFVYAPAWHERLPGQKRLKGGFYGFDATTGKLRWKYERPYLKGASVIVSEGCLFALDTNGYLYKFVRSRPAPPRVRVAAVKPGSRSARSRAAASK